MHFSYVFLYAAFYEKQMALPCVAKINHYVTTTWESTSEQESIHCKLIKRCAACGTGAGSQLNHIEWVSGSLQTEFRW